MGLLKPRGQSATETRHLKLHGSTPARGMNKWGGELRRLNEKPYNPAKPGKPGKK
jgi:hypothetical protein